MKSVLIADDERAAREGIAQAVDWERLGIGRVILAADGAEAFQSIESERPDIAIVDIVMPEMTGIELISAFRDDAEAPEFLIVSGHDEFGYAQQAIRCNVHDYLLKPCDPLEMEESIRRALEKIERRQARSSIDPETAQAAPFPRSVSGHRDAKGRGGFAGSSPRAFSDPVQRTVAYVHEHLQDRNLSLSYIASHVVYMHPDYLGRLFKKEVGVRFSDFLTSARIERAKALLASSQEIKIYEVAKAVGLGENPAYFGQLFRKATGMLPSEFRERQLGATTS